jgi:hypothetical protein
VSGVTNPQPSEEDQAVINWYHEGVTQQQVGLKAGMSASKVKRVLRRHGVPARRRGNRSWADVNGPEAERQVITAYREGMPLRDIEATFGPGRKSIARLLSAMTCHADRWAGHGQGHGRRPMSPRTGSCC